MPEPLIDEPSAHAHGSSCYWDLRECRWVCPTSAASAASAADAVRGGTDTGPRD